VRGICRNHNEMRKVHEDFEWADEIICWECGNKIIELIGQNTMKYLDKIDEVLNGGDYRSQRTATDSTPRKGC